MRDGASAAFGWSVVVAVGLTFGCGASRDGNGEDLLPASRVTAGLVALYDFEEVGPHVLDVSGVSPVHNLSLENPTSVSWSQGSVRLTQPTRLITIGPATKLVNAVRKSHQLTLEAWITPDSVDQTAPARVASLAESGSHRNVTLSQGTNGGVRTAFEAQLRMTSTTNDGKASATSAGAATTSLTHVVFTRATSGQTRIYVDGVQKKADYIGGNMQVWTPMAFALGNEVGAAQPWLGKLHLVAFYDRALSQSEVIQNFEAGPGDAPAPPNQAPEASFELTPTSGMTPLTVVFDASASTDVDGTIETYAWDFGDGATSSELMPSHTYETAGTYEVTLTVSDDAGATAEATRSVEVTKAEPVHVQMPLTATTPSSSSVRLRWDGVPSAASIAVYAGPEPASVAGAPLPLEETVATLAGTATETTVTGLAAKTDVFFRVVATTSEGTRWGVAAVRTPGGPRALLDTALRSVHLLAPNVLQLELETKGIVNGVGARGAAWQGGEWTVARQSGALLGVNAVHRQSIPVAQPNYPVAYNQAGNDRIVDQDDRIFLVLAEPVGAREMLRVSHAGGGMNTDLAVTVPVSDSYLETPLIKVNQLGYNPRAGLRYAYLSGYLGDGGVLDLASLPSTASVLAEPLDKLGAYRTVQSALPLTVRTTQDDEAGGAVMEIDMRTVPPAEGVRYRVKVPGVGVSYPTAVSEEAALRAFYATARGLFHNRFCGNLAPEYTDWSRPPDHCSAYFVTGVRYSVDKFPQTTPLTDPRPLVGGHHDAGDFDIRPFHVLVAQYLMRAYERTPGGFFDGQLHLPESGNGIPDLLDEALWSIAAWEALQNPDGSVRAGVESWGNVRGIHFANDDLLPYWTWEPEIWHTAYVAGLFAQAAYLVRPFDVARSDALIERALRAYDWSVAQNGPEEYRMYALAELARVTGETAYKVEYERLWSTLSSTGPFQNFRAAQSIYPGSFIQNTPTMPDFLMAYAKLPDADPSRVNRIRSELLKLADAESSLLFGTVHGMRNARPANQRPDWGASASTGRQVDGIYQVLELPSVTNESRQRYFDVMSLAADYALGGNPAGRVYLTGLGTIGPEQLLHNDSLSFVKARGLPQIPGLPAFGPIEAATGATYFNAVKAAFYPPFDSHPRGLRYADTRAAVNTNEFSVWESQAPMVELFAALAPPLMPDASWAPGQPGARLRLTSHTAD